MTVTEVKQALGSWEIRLREETPKWVLDILAQDYFGHIAVIPNKINPAEYGDNILGAGSARYVGVYRERDAQNEFLLRGVGMAFWLGVDDAFGDVFETEVSLTAQTFAATVAALLPPGGAVTSGTINSVAGTYTGVHKYQTPRRALDYIMELFGAEYRVNNNGTLDAGTAAQLYNMTPRAILVNKKEPGREMNRVAVPGQSELTTDVVDYTTRLLLLAEDSGATIATGSADNPLIPYTDIHGNPVALTRVVSEAETTSGNADARAQLILNLYSNKRNSVGLSTNAYDLKGDVVVGDMLYVYDPNNGFYDPTVETFWEGQPINPVPLRCVEMTWPIPAGWTVAFRRTNGDWIDLSPYYAPESGDTTITVGGFSPSLTDVGSQPVVTRTGPVAPDTTVPGTPAFTGFSSGVYQSSVVSDVKAMIRVEWTTPLNLDASTITDGDHYELRYRSNAVIGYQVTHDEMALFTHDDFGTHDAMLSSPVQADPQWTIINVGWGTNVITIPELTPGVEYQFQIRAVDNATPPNRGPYSASTFYVAQGDIIAPSVPAPPVVAGNLISVLVTHTLGKASGGTYNLELDLDHLEVHIGGESTFTPDSGSKLGSLIANASMMGANVPAVGTFTTDQTGVVYIKVVAVDRSGNKSGASGAASVTAELIPDQYITNLTASKITAGTLSAVIINAGKIATAVSGDRLELTGDGLEAWTLAGYRSIFLDGSENRIMFNQPPFLESPVEVGLTSDGTWGMLVQDLFGVTKLRVGQLDPAGSPSDSDNYGLGGLNSLGQLVKLSTIMFGRKDATTAGTTCNNSLYVDGVTNFGPEIQNVQIGSTGQCVVHLSASADFTSVAPTAGSTGLFGGHMSFTVTDQSNGSVVLVADDDRAAGWVLEWPLGIAGAGTTFGYEAGIARSLTISLPPGLYTFTAKYRSLSGAGATIFRTPYMIVEPR